MVMWLYWTISVHLLCTILISSDARTINQHSFEKSCQMPEKYITLLSGNPGLIILFLSVRQIICVLCYWGWLMILVWCSSSWQTACTICELCMSCHSKTFTIILCVLLVIYPLHVNMPFLSYKNLRASVLIDVLFIHHVPFPCYAVSF